MGIWIRIGIWIKVLIWGLIKRGFFDDGFGDLVRKLVEVFEVLVCVSISCSTATTCCCRVCRGLTAFIHHTKPRTHTQTQTQTQTRTQTHTLCFCRSKYPSLSLCFCEWGINDKNDKSSSYGSRRVGTERGLSIKILSFLGLKRYGKMTLSPFLERNRRKR